MQGTPGAANEFADIYNAIEVDDTQTNRVVDKYLEINKGIRLSISDYTRSSDNAGIITGTINVGATIIPIEKALTFNDRPELRILRGINLSEIIFPPT